MKFLFRILAVWTLIIGVIMYIPLSLIVPFLRSLVSLWDQTDNFFKTGHWQWELTESNDEDSPR